tara:strand:- start:7045 stop:7398 length:354 start_codon:yes stop_codon:yes gene_type:complete
MIYRIEDKIVTREEFVARKLNKGKIEEVIESRTAPGGHEPYWGTGHDSVSCSVPEGQAGEHQKWCEDKGLVDFSIAKDGTVSHGSPRGRDTYLAARGMADAGSAGSDARASVIKRGK